MMSGPPGGFSKEKVSNEVSVERKTVNCESIHVFIASRESKTLLTGISLTSIMTGRKSANHAIKNGAGITIGKPAIRPLCRRALVVANDGYIDLKQRV